MPGHNDPPIGVEPNKSGNVGLDSGVARVLFQRFSQFFQGAVPFTLAAMHVAGEGQRLRVVRLQFDRALELSQRQVILPRAIIVKNV